MIRNDKLVRCEPNVTNLERHMEKRNWIDYRPVRLREVFCNTGELSLQCMDSRINLYCLPESTRTGRLRSAEMEKVTENGRVV